MTAQSLFHLTCHLFHVLSFKISGMHRTQTDTAHTTDALIFVCFLRLSRINSAHGTGCGTQAAFHALLISFRLEGNAAIFLVSTVVSLKV